MRVLPIAGVVVSLGVLQSACSSCSGNSNNAHDAGPDTDTDTDTDTDSDADADTDSDTDSDTVSDAGPWEWTDLPPSEDCGPGCEQFTYGDGVEFLQWDVWDDRLAYRNGDSQAVVVDTTNRKQILIPAPVDDCVWGTNCFAQFPSVFENRVYYGLLANSPHRSVLVRADIQDHVQDLLYTTVDTGEEGWETIYNVDVYNNRAFSTGGCDNNSTSEMCFFPLDSLGEVVALSGSYYGGYNSIWGDVAVWFTLDYEGDTLDIEGYDFSTSEFFYITQDVEHQLDPKIQGNTVVYMDLKLGDSYLDGNWNHAAIFAYDIATHETTQITSGEWVAAYPDVYDNIIVWLDYRASSDPNNAMSFDGVEIWGYNMDTATEFQITNISGRPKQTPRIWGDKVFVDMANAGGNAIYMFDLPDGAK